MALWGLCRCAEAERNRERPAGRLSEEPAVSESNGRARPEKQKTSHWEILCRGQSPFRPVFWKADGPGQSPARLLQARYRWGEWTGAEARPLIGDKMRTCPEERPRLSEGEKDGIIESAYLKNRHTVFGAGFARRRVNCAARRL